MSDKPDKKTREIMDKVYAMSPEEISQLLAEAFARLCKQPLPSPTQRGTEAKPC